MIFSMQILISNPIKFKYFQLFLIPVKDNTVIIPYLDLSEDSFQHMTHLEYSQPNITHLPMRHG